MEKVRPTILMICDYYLPGFESGGAMRTLVNMVDRLSDEFDFKIVCRDHDGPLNREPYTTVRINDRNQTGNAEVYYLSKNNITIGRIKRLVRETSPDAIYLNSFFSPLTVFTLLLRRFGPIGSVPVVLAPEGELVSGALSIKPLKKQLYIRFAKLLNLFDKIVWKAASEYEKQAIESIFGSNVNGSIAPNMPPRAIRGDLDLGEKPEKLSGQARLIFLSRFMRKKNFNWFLDVVRNVPGKLSIDIYGPIEDLSYWDEYEEIVTTLPENIKVEAKGTVPYEDVAKTLSQYHFFVLPTLGENFGHIFVEALAAGCPLVISDRSPWRDLEAKGVGWDTPLETREKWLSVINVCLAMNDDEYRSMSARAREFAEAWLSDPVQEESNRNVLRTALNAAR